MSLRETIQEIAALDRAIKDQVGYIDSFRRSNRDNTTLVNSELTGSNRGHDAAMLTALRQADQSLIKAEGALKRASDALQRVQTL